MSSERTTIWIPDDELDNRESPNWIAVYKPGLEELVKELNAARERIIYLESWLRAKKK